MQAYRRFLRERSGKRPAAPAKAPERPVVFNPRTGERVELPVRAGGRTAAIEWAVRMVADPRVVYLDTETTGVLPADEVIEIAICGNTGETLFETLIRPSRPIPAGAMAVHGITDEDVADAPSLPEVHHLLHDWLHGRPVIVYNASFDKRLIAQSCQRHGFAPPDAVYECAMLKYAAFAAAPSARGTGNRWHKLEQAVRAFGEPPGGHRAAADALACRAVVHGMAASLPNPD